MHSIPLITHGSSDSVVAWRTAGSGVTVAVTRRQFLADVMALADRYPAGQGLLNLCSDRYRFSVGLGAAIVTDKVSLLPSTHTPGVMRQIQDYSPGVFCLTDNAECSLALPQLRYPDQQTNDSRDWPVPHINARQTFAVLFTSGSTGEPQPHPKTWGSMAGCVQAEAACFGLSPGTACTLVGTVPPQHSYGFESTVHMAWQNGFALSHTHPFYPADIVAALAAVPAPRVLISSPVHLRALIESGVKTPELHLIVSATAPLAPELAHSIETYCNAPLMEIYGSTETGQVASRRTTSGQAWQLFSGVRFTRVSDDAGKGDDQRICASGGHVGAPIIMSDLIEMLNDREFLLHGRLADMVNIAGKRHSLTSLNHLLNNIPGVQDGAFYMPDTPDASANGWAARLAACVVAPTLDAQRLIAALREHLDPVFLPRPLLFVQALPRNNTGKLPREDLQKLFQDRVGRSSP